jgi:hypothetical protein
MNKKNTLTIVIVVVVALILIIVGLSFGPKLVRSIRGGGDDGGGENETTTEPNKPPTAILTASAYVARENEGITFDGNESFDIDYTGNLSNKGIFLFMWDWGDGTEVEVTENGTEIHTFADQGYYNVELTVFDEDEASDTTNVTIQIVPQDTFISSGTQILIGEPLVPGIRILQNSTETNWTLKKNAKSMNITVTVSGFYAQDISENHVEILLYNPWEDLLVNETIEIMGSDAVSWDFEEEEISIPGEYYVFIQCSKGAAFVSVEGQVSYLE